MITILFIGDVVGEPGRTAVKHMLPEFKREHGADFIIVNGENAAAGRGITPRLANRGCCAPSTIHREHRGTGA